MPTAKPYYLPTSLGHKLAATNRAVDNALDDDDPDWSLRQEARQLCRLVQRVLNQHSSTPLMAAVQHELAPAMAAVFSVLRDPDASQLRPAAHQLVTLVELLLAFTTKPPQTDTPIAWVECTAMYLQRLRVLRDVLFYSSHELPTPLRRLLDREYNALGRQVERAVLPSVEVPLPENVLLYEGNKVELGATHAAILKHYGNPDLWQALRAARTELTDYPGTTAAFLMVIEQEV